MSSGAKRNARGHFLPGHSGNPGGVGGGRPPVPDDLKGVQRLASQTVELLIAKFVAMPLEDFTEFVQKKRGTMLEIMIASVIHKGVIKGEPAYLDFLFSRTIGKIKDEAESAATEAAAAQLAESVPVETVVAYLKDRKRA